VPTTPEPLASISINEERLLAALDDLLIIDSLGGTGAELDAQDAVAKTLRTDGWEVESWDLDVAHLVSLSDFPGMEVDRTGGRGVLARWAGSGGGPAILIDAHTDVVPPGDIHAWSGDPFVPRRFEVNGRDSIVARGSCDMKAGLVAACEAMRAINEAGITLRGDVLFAPVSGEEDGGLGTYALLQHGVVADMCLVPEPTDLAVVPANGGALTFRLKVHGAAVHASRRTEGVSAIEKFFPIYQALTALEARRNASVDALMQRWPIAYPLSIGTVHSGDWASTVPDLLIAEGRLGVALDESVDNARAEFEQAVADACAADPWLRDHPVDVEWWGGQFAPGRTDTNESVVTLLGESHFAVTGRNIEMYGGPYGSDLRLLSGIGGIPTVQYGPGDAAAAHAPNEWVATQDVLTSARVIADFLIRAAG
jgi:acetylornithine deacetylase